jgi:hypothetical protein
MNKQLMSYVLVPDHAALGWGRVMVANDMLIEQAEELPADIVVVPLECLAEPSRNYCEGLALDA